MTRTGSRSDSDSDRTPAGPIRVDRSRALEPLSKGEGPGCAAAVPSPVVSESLPSDPRSDSDARHCPDELWAAARLCRVAGDSRTRAPCSTNDSASDPENTENDSENDSENGSETAGGRGSRVCASASAQVRMRARAHACVRACACVCVCVRACFHLHQDDEEGVQDAALNTLALVEGGCQRE